MARSHTAGGANIAGWRRALAPTARPGPRLRFAVVGEGSCGPPAGPFLGSTVKVLPYATGFTALARESYVPASCPFSVVTIIPASGNSSQQHCTTWCRASACRRTRLLEKKKAAALANNCALPASARGKRELCRQASEARRFSPGRPHWKPPPGQTRTMRAVRLVRRCFLSG